jgi:hypothetical protein
MSETALVPMNSALTPGDLFKSGKQAAEICREIVLRNSVIFRGPDGKERRYLETTAWQALATVSGRSVRIDSVQEVDGGVAAVCSLVKISDGSVIARAEGFVGVDEALWYGGTVTDRFGKTKTFPKRTNSAIRAMAQSRAISRAYRAGLAWMLPLIDGSLAAPAPDDGELPPDQWEEQQPRERLPQKEPAPRVELASGKQKALIQTLTKSLDEDQIQQLKSQFGPVAELTKARASELIDRLQKGPASQPVNEDSEPVT